MGNDIYLEPEAQEFAEATANPPYLFDLGPEKGRQTVDEVQSGPVAKLPVDMEDRPIEGGPSGQVSVRILRPQNAPPTLPIIVYIHGAGWVFGNNHTHDRLIRELPSGPRPRWCSRTTACRPRPSTPRRSSRATPW
jgi:acetyl esterase